MNIEELVQKNREIWGNQKLTLAEIIVCMGKVYGDICRWERNAPKDMATHTDQELKKELGNLIFATIRWCEELGYHPEECIKIAEQVQRSSASSLCKKRL